MQPILEQIEPDERHSFAWRRSQLDRFSFFWHVHPEAELTWIVSGRGTRYVGDDVADFREGDLVLLAPNVPHTWSSPAGGPGRVESVYVQFLPECSGATFLEQPELRAVRRLLERASVGLRFTGRITAEASESLLAMESAKPLQRMLSLWELLDRLAHSRSTRPLSTRPFVKPLREEDRRRIDRVCRAVEGRFTEQLTLADGAQIAHLHPAAFARWFKGATGQTFVEHLHRLRVGYAARLLIETEAPITEVAFDSGFNNLSHFHRVFRRIKQTTPSAYRKSFIDGAARG